MVQHAVGTPPTQQTRIHNLDCVCGKQYMAVDGEDANLVTHATHTCALAHPQAMRTKHQEGYTGIHFTKRKRKCHAWGTSLISSSSVARRIISWASMGRPHTLTEQTRMQKSLHTHTRCEREQKKKHSNHRHTYIHTWIVLVVVHIRPVDLQPLGGEEDHLIGLDQVSERVFIRKAQQGHTV